MRLTMEIPAKQEHDYEVAGFSREKNKKFWQQENLFNGHCFRLIYGALLVSNFLFNAMLFVVRFETDLYIYIFFQNPEHRPKHRCGVHFFTLNLFSEFVRSKPDAILCQALSLHQEAD